MVDPVVWEDIGVAVVLIGVTVALMYWAFHRLRRRQGELSKELAESKASIEDRAFNEIHLARSAADHLARSGHPVEGVQRLIERASDAYQGRDFPNALAMASSAREALLHVRTTPSVSPATIPSAPDGSTSDPLASSSGPTHVLPVPTMAPDGGDEMSPATTSRLPRNKAESHFQLKLLDDDLAAATTAQRSDAAAVEARATAAEAHASYDRGDFTEALRLGLKGRRRIGARLETLPPPSAPAQELPAPSGASSEVAVTSNCSTCGQPMRATDQFCRGCGTSRSTGRCAQCGEPMTGADRFCGVCGAPVRT